MQWNKRTRAGLALLLVLTVLAVMWWRSQSTGVASDKASKSPPPAPVRVAVVARQTVPLQLQSVGQLQALQSVVVRPQMEGVLTQVLFKEGQPVKRGQLLARLDDRHLVAQEAQSRAALAQLQAQWQQARQDLQRDQGLAAQSAISAQQLEQRTAQVAQLQAQVRAQQAQLQGVQVQRSYASIVSPMDGRVGLKQVDVGNLVSPSNTDGLVTVVQTQPMAVVFPLPQTRLASMQVSPARLEGAPVGIAQQVEGAAAWTVGHVVTADNQVDTATGTLRVKAQVDNRDGRWWPGQFVSVRLQTGELPDALVVPFAAVQKGQQGDMVWRLRDSEKGLQAHMLPVVVRWQDDDRAVVEGELQAGDRVVIDGHARLKPNAMVRVVSGAAVPAKASAAREP